jgi:hypothetical protein
MDGKTFDRITKGLSSGTSRRRMLGGLGAGGIGLLAGRSAAGKARPVNNGNGCSQAGRVCEAGTCCGSQLTCAAEADLASSCTNAAGNAKCCFQPGATCRGHCECCAPSTGCINGVCV